MSRSNNLRKVIALVIMCIIGFGLGYLGVSYFKKTHPNEIQRQPAPLLPQ